MPRNGSGVYTLPQPPFVPNTTISSAAVNSDYSDIANALTGSVASDGQTPISGSLKGYAGANNTTLGYTFAVDTDTGRWRPDSGEMEDVCNGTTVAEYSETGVNFPVGASVAGIPVSTSSFPIGAAMMWSGRSAPPLWVLVGATYSRATYADLWTFAQAEIAAGNTLYGPGNGTTTFTIGTMDGYAVAGVDAAAARISGFTHVGDTAGASTVTLDTTQIPPHTHTADVTDTGHFHGAGDAVLSAGLGGSGLRSYTGSGTTGNTTSATTGISVTNQNTGGGGAHNNVQPSRAWNFIIYAGV